MFEIFLCKCQVRLVPWYYRDSIALSIIISQKKNIKLIVPWPQSNLVHNPLHEREKFTNGMQHNVRLRTVQSNDQRTITRYRILHRVDLAPRANNDPVPATASEAENWQLYGFGGLARLSTSVGGTILKNLVLLFRHDTTCLATIMLNHEEALFTAYHIGHSSNVSPSPLRLLLPRTNRSGLTC